MLNSPLHDVDYHMMLQKSGAKVLFFFEISKSYLFKSQYQS